MRPARARNCEAVYTAMNDHSATPHDSSNVADLLLTTSEGAPLRLASLWQERPALLFFLRHFGCAICRAELFRLRERGADFQARNAAVAVIVPADAIAAARFGQQYRLPFPLLADPLRRAYRSFGLHEGRLLEAIGPAATVRQLREALRGNMPYIGLNGAPLRQLGGVVIVGQTGVIHLLHVAQPIYAYPSVDTYLRIIDTAQNPL